MPASEKLRFAVEDGGGVSALLLLPAEPRLMLVLAHGAGAGMTHPFLESLAAELAAVGVATLRYQFPYMEQLRRVPDSPAVLTATVRAAVHAAAGQPLDGIRGLVFFGFPLQPPHKPGTKRAEHLKHVTVPMLFLQGTRDTLADLTLLKPICDSLGSRATLHIIETADHSFHVLKKSGKADADALRELAQTTASWALRI